MHQMVMCRAKQHEVLKCCFSSVLPMLHVMTMYKAPIRAARKPTATAPCLESSSYRRRNGPRTPSHVERSPLSIHYHANHARIAGDPPKCFRGNSRAVFESAAQHPIGP